MYLKLIGEIIGAVAIAENLFIFVSLRRERILKLKFVSDTLWLFNYLCLGGYTGAVLNAIAMARETVFSLRGRKRFASHGFWLPVFLLLTLISPALEWIGDGAFSPWPLLPALGSMLTVVGLYQSRPKITRYIAFFAQGLWLAYAISLPNISSIVCNSLLILSALIGAIRERLVERRKMKEPETPSKPSGFTAEPPLPHDKNA